MQPSIAFPKGRVAEPRLYVVEFNNGNVKVGRSQDIRRRARELVWDPFRTGIHLTNGWCSDPDPDSLANEMRLILFCREQFGEPVSKTHETFAADFDAVAAYARTLTLAADAA